MSCKTLSNLLHRLMQPSYAFRKQLKDIEYSLDKMDVSKSKDILDIWNCFYRYVSAVDSTFSICSDMVREMNVKHRHLLCDRASTEDLKKTIKDGIKELKKETCIFWIFDISYWTTIAILIFVLAIDMHIFFVGILLVVLSHLHILLKVICYDSDCSGCVKDPYRYSKQD